MSAEAERLTKGDFIFLRSIGFALVEGAFYDRETGAIIALKGLTTGEHFTLENPAPDTFETCRIIIRVLIKHKWQTLTGAVGIVYFTNLPQAVAYARKMAPRRIYQQIKVCLLCPTADRLYIAKFIKT